MRRLMFQTLAAAVALAAPALAAPVSLMFGEPDARHVTFTFAEDRLAADALAIETRRVGNPGASLRIWIDRSGSPLFERILTEDDCRFDDSGAVCRLVFAGNSADYARFVVAFKAGLSVHVEVANASVMEMQDDVSLEGFTAAYGG